MGSRIHMPNFYRGIGFEEFLETDELGDRLVDTVADKEVLVLGEDVAEIVEEERRSNKSRCSRY